MKHNNIFEKRLCLMVLMTFIACVSICSCSDSTSQKDRVSSFLFSSSSPPASVPTLAPQWAKEVRYENLIRIKEVRDLVSKHAAMAKKNLTLEELTAFCDKMIPLGISIEKSIESARTINEQIGIKTGKEYSDNFLNPPGIMIVSALCSFARNGIVLRQVQQYEDGCLLEAVVPSSIWSYEGILYVSVRKAGTGTRVDAATLIKGQIFDWGKSKNCLEVLFADLKATPV